VAPANGATKRDVIESLIRGGPAIRRRPALTVNYFQGGPLTTVLFSPAIAWKNR
jgi:hypothetical protein